LLIDEIFDGINSHSPFVSGSKQAETRENIEDGSAFFNSSEVSLQKLTNLQGIPKINTKLRSFIVGFIT
jgi:hypothetical protein